MIKRYSSHILLAFGLCASFIGCQQATDTRSDTKETIRSKQAKSLNNSDTTLVAILEMDSVVSLSDSLPILFKVYNPTTDTLRFTQYHTPFEGFLNNFLTITDEDGKEVSYRGAMAKRVMPPPAETYCLIAPQDHDSVAFSIMKGYQLEKPGHYTIHYNAGNVSGMANGSPIRIQVTE
ncbi:hypothetical protein H8S90_15685 [Olivibacter sp. SDN3]|uniref:hypothetical protein n=1 Tax=Olivibacter sp. SDN3 TaxID=2764720 RepID=UPI0016511F68|nr:hypothetical protein [Olivibacter sp. SDN3]QNL48237.1 hypothetical protein H8S90_15685 [Olivibacter sp. SDN3]